MQILLEDQLFFLMFDQPLKIMNNFFNQKIIIDL